MLAWLQILKQSRDFLLCTKKVTSLFYLYDNLWLLPIAYNLYSLRNQTTSCQYKLSKMLSE